MIQACQVYRIILTAFGGVVRGEARFDRRIGPASRVKAARQNSAISTTVARCPMPEGKDTDDDTHIPSSPPVPPIITFQILVFNPSRTAC